MKGAWVRTGGHADEYKKGKRFLLLIWCLSFEEMNSNSLLVKCLWKGEFFLLYEYSSSLNTCARTESDKQEERRTSEKWFCSVRCSDSCSNWGRQLFIQGKAKSRTWWAETEFLGYPYEGLGSRGGFSLNKVKKEASCWGNSAKTLWARAWLGAWKDINTHR